jgi:exopolysaccharide biosynthesis polyprenyl glycosylphosphotransferase
VFLSDDGHDRQHQHPIGPRGAAAEDPAVTPREVLEERQSTASGREGPSRSRGAERARAATAAPARRPAYADESPRWWRDVLRRRLLAMADITAAGFAVVVSTSIVELPWALAPLPLWILFAKLLGLYDRDHKSIRHLTFDELTALAAWALVGTAALALVLPLTPAEPLSTGAYVQVAVCALAAAFLLRAAARGLWRRLTPRERTTVIGEGELAAATRRKVELFRDMHLELADDDELAREALEGDDAEKLDPLVKRVDRVIVATDRMDSELIGRLAIACRRNQVKLSVVSSLRGRAGPQPLISQVADLSVLEYDTWDVSRSTVLLKRGFDLLVAGAATIVLLPLLPLVALAIKLDSRGPVFFVQLRAGLNGEAFRMFKFRTMIAGAEESLDEVVAIDELPDPMFKLRRDPRITRVGRVLRRLSVDELPQLVNVIKGDMSIVGPRPEQIELVERYQPEHRFRLQVKPGMTGPMQVFGRGELTFPERLAVELDYVENLSLARDLRILAQTFPVVLRGTGAY